MPDSEQPAASRREEFPFYAIVSLVLSLAVLFAPLVPVLFAPLVPVVEFLYLPCTLVGALLAVRSLLEERLPWNLIAALVAFLVVLVVFFW